MRENKEGHEPVRGGLYNARLTDYFTPYSLFTMATIMYNGQEVEVTDATPTWSGLVAYFANLLTDGKAANRQNALDHLCEMAKAADRHNELADKFNKLVDEFNALQAKYDALTNPQQTDHAPDAAN